MSAGHLQLEILQLTGERFSFIQDEGSISISFKSYTNHPDILISLLTFLCVKVVSRFT